jgi:hypothetical protein
MSTTVAGALDCLQDALDRAKIHVPILGRYRFKRLGEDKPLVDPSAINLGTATEDVRDLEVVYP